MFFKSRKQAKIEEENRKKEQQFLEEEKAKKEREYHVAFNENERILYRIFDMVRSLPKERQIVVVQRKNIFRDSHERNQCYLNMAQRMSYEYWLHRKKWISGHDDALYAFYKPTDFSLELTRALGNFSKGGYRIQRIRYYRDQF